ncbi:putative cyclin-dependent serine/threonine-protein kinase DDB_G0272797/DDB_G0274007 isoform X1 [Sabethes cyaneus]|uniref:putative cyclin-dependent serine/threonine-protein kinase DDB_G0272797/DDB_G0274007 isoform X1 n=1 Tax=Sabethes cyaneus TaxID=53552 RepID=UPI00221E35D0|nr:putative cyclin-dependent serine/threonine-protein kinase DDB_G0272797/DDB_G0274007 isoform X1 [Sabethes cyaneus]XP_053698313.1 putative cyclin-dependent serine/threonine-protein kinase DDB_G0272797/DDB_G0274007 isoform X1 [Sabethes cyaneus]
MKRVAVTLVLFVVVAFGQRVVPGVNPNQYQQQQQGQYHPPPPPQYNNQQPPQHQQQHYQQPPPQQQQPQFQQQQVPVQPQYQQHQQQPPRPGQGQYQGGQPQQVLNTHNLQQEKQHIAEHMEVPIDTSKMSEQELQFHYFKMHDADNNNKLDGCELIKSLIHWHDAKEGEEHHNEGEQRAEAHPQDDDTLQSLIDPIMELMDKDHDGFITYMEYRQAELSQAAKDGN